MRSRLALNSFPPASFLPSPKAAPNKLVTALILMMSAEIFLSYSRKDQAASISAA
jgi:hypothetical protein